MNENFKNTKNNKLWDQIKNWALKEYDAIFGVTYKVFVINTASKVQLYSWKKWKSLYPKMDSILSLTNEPAFIRSFQSFEFENKWLGFGRMKWNESNNIKWTTKYRADNTTGKKLEFFNTEIWSPDWNHYSKKGELPKVFVKVYHHENYQALNEGILIAIQNRIFEKNRTLINSKIKEMHELVADSKLGSVNRYWHTGKGFTNQIQDIGPQELEKIIQ